MTDPTDSHLSPSDKTKGQSVTVTHTPSDREDIDPPRLVFVVDGGLWTERLSYICQSPAPSFFRRTRPVCEDKPVRPSPVKYSRVGGKKGPPFPTPVQWGYWSPEGPEIRDVLFGSIMTQMEVTDGRYFTYRDGGVRFRSSPLALEPFRR